MAFGSADPRWPGCPDCATQQISAARVCGSYPFRFGDVSCTVESRMYRVTSGPGHADRYGKLRSLAWLRRPGRAGCESTRGTSGGALDALSWACSRLGNLATPFAFAVPPITAVPS